MFSHLKAGVASPLDGEAVNRADRLFFSINLEVSWNICFLVVNLTKIVCFNN